MLFYNKSNNTEMYKEKVTGFTGPTLIGGYMVPFSGDQYWEGSPSYNLATTHMSPNNIIEKLAKDLTRHISK